MNSLLEKAKQAAAAATAKAEEMEKRCMELIGRAVADAAREDEPLRKRIAEALEASRMTKPDRALIAYWLAGSD